MISLKAKRYVGHFSLKTGCIISSLILWLTGFFLSYSLNYLRPQLVVISVTYLVIYFSIGCFGLVATINRSVILMWIFAGLMLLANLNSLALTSEFLDFIHILPAPPVRPTENSDILPLKDVQAATIINSISPIDPEKLKQDGHERYEKQHDLHNDGEDITLIQKAFKNLYKKLDLEDSEMSNFLGLKKNSDSPNEDSSDGKIVEGLPPKTFEHSPEEVAKSELPLETQNMSLEGKLMVTSTIKIFKHVFRIMIAVVSLILTMLNFYHFWVTSSFALNKCISFDVLEEMPDQFEPILIDHETILAEDLELDSESVEEKIPLKQNSVV